MNPVPASRNSPLHCRVPDLDKNLCHAVPLLPTLLPTRRQQGAMAHLVVGGGLSGAGDLLVVAVHHARLSSVGAAAGWGKFFLCCSECPRPHVWL